jgi:hypothetical protein
VVGQVDLVADLMGLCAFVLLCVAFFAVGYFLKMRSYSDFEIGAPDGNEPTGWIKASAAYYAIYGVALLVAYGATGPLAVIDAIRHPGSAYLAKFEVYDLQNATGQSNGTIQLMTLLAVLYTPLIPFLTLYWTNLSRRLRMISVASAGVYASFFLFIGTLKGLGDLLVFLLASYLIRTVWPGKTSSARSRRRLIALTAIGLTVFVSYMAFNQSQRLQETGIQNRFQPNPVIASVAGENFARGMAVVAFYPTHGYVGLAYNLGTPFEWSGGLGASRALNSYWMQYVGGEGASKTAYPVRTEVRTGWPADAYWSTIYPWLASDLTFPGTVLFMGFLGWFLAKFWYEAAYKRSLLAVLLFCQLILLIAYVPANNQIGTSRTSLIAFICLAAVYVLNRVTSQGRRL